MNRKVLFTVFKLAFLSGALWWLSRTVDIHRVGGLLTQADPSFLIGGLLLSVAPLLLAGYRWSLLLNAVAIPIATRSLISIVYVGQFFTLFVPGLAGDDVTRALYISRLAPGRVREALTTVAIDRGLGLCSLFLVALVAIPANWTVLSAQPHVRWACTLFLGVALFILIGCGSFFLLPQRYLTQIVEWIRAKFPNSRTLQDVCSVANALVVQRHAVLTCLLSAIFTQIILCGVFWLAGQAVRVDLSLLKWMSFVPIILLSNLLPITFAGVGIRDYLLLLFIPATQFDPDRVAAVSLLMLAFGIITALLGGAVYVCFRPASRTKAVEVEVA